MVLKTKYYFWIPKIYKSTSEDTKYVVLAAKITRFGSLNQPNEAQKCAVYALQWMKL